MSVPSTGQQAEAIAHSRRIVVGVDGSASSIAALRWAAAEAQLRGSDTFVEAVLAWQLPFAGQPPLADVPSTHRAESEAMRHLEDILDAALPPGPTPEPEIRPRVCEGTPTNALLTAATNAEMLVVGHKGYGLVTDVVRGSVGVRCLARAECPVVIIPSPVS